MLHQLNFIILYPTCTPLTRKAILTLANKGSCSTSHSQRWLWGLQGYSKHTDVAPLLCPMLPLEEPFQLLLPSNIPTGGLCGELMRPAVNSSPQPARPEGRSVLAGGSSVQLLTAGMAHDFLLFNRTVVCLGILLWGLVEECTVCPSVCHYTSWACPCICGGLSALQWREHPGSIWHSPSCPWIRGRDPNLDTSYNRGAGHKLSLPQR